MMKWIFTILILLSVIFGSGLGRISQVSTAAISECGKAVELSITLAGSICMWNGLMRVAQKSGLTKKIAEFLSPITSKLFQGIEKGSLAMQLITMNITANLLGLGNAATPLGIAAITELEKDTPTQLKGTANNNMIILVVMNTASIQLIPTTVAVLRNKYNASNPLDILPAVLISSLVSLTVGITIAKLLNRILPAKQLKDS